MREDHNDDAADRGLFRTLFALLLIAATVAATAWLSRPPAVRDSDAAGQFSSKRAMAHLAIIAQRPHPTGSPENARVRDYLVAQLRAMGLRTEVQRTLVTGDAHGRAAEFAWIENVVGVLPGTQRDDALLLMSHYDSTAWAPGAADAGSAVVSVLEAARIAAATDPASRKRDLIVLLSDGEEIGLFGARGFFERHPLAKQVGTVLNFESRGSRGPVRMFQTGPDNADLIRLLARGPSPTANSYAQEIYRWMPNDTDFTVSLANRRAGMNFAYIDGYFDYHSPTDTVENLAPETLQHLGDQAVNATTGLLASSARGAGAGDLHYMNFTGKTFFFYPPWVDVVALALATILSLVAFVRAKRAQSVRIGATLVAMLGLIAAIGSAAAVVWSVSAAVRAEYWPGAMLRAVAAQQTLWFIAWALCGVGVAVAVLAVAARRGLRWKAALALAVFASVPALRAGGVFLPGLVLALIAWLLLRRPLGTAAMAWGGRALALVLGWALMIAMPGAANLLVWPLLAFALAAILLRDRDAANKGAGRRTMWAMASAAAVMVAAVILGDFARNLDVALGAGMPVIGVVPLLLLLALSIEFWQGRRAAAVGLGLAVVGAGFAFALSMQNPFDTRHPRPSGVFVLQDRLLNADCFASIDASADDWQRKIMGDAAKPLKGNNYAPEVWRDTRCAPLEGRAAVLPAASLALDTVAIAPTGKDGVRRMQLRLRASGGRDRLDLYLPKGVDVRAAQVDGRSLPVPAEEGFDAWPRRLRAFALPDEDVALSLDIGPGRLPDALLAVNYDHDLPPTLRLPAHPPGSMSQTHDFADASIVVKRLPLAPAASATLAPPTPASASTTPSAGKQL
ncbi:MAG: M28 family peptidase [Lysobacter sp.]|nr:M28 family peptidase [Lysobacter sp.]